MKKKKFKLEEIDSKTKFLFLLLTDFRLLLKTFGFLLALSIIIGIGIGISSLFVRTINPEVSLKVTNGTLELSSRNNIKIATLLLSPNGGNKTKSPKSKKRSPWINTGIEINTRDIVKINASGQICLAIHHLVKSGINDSLPILPWTGPGGVNLKDSTIRTIRDIDLKRQDNYRVLSSAPIGSLLGVISEGDPIDIDTSEIIKIGDGRKFNSKNKCGFLWLTINETWISDSIINKCKNNMNEFNHYSNHLFPNDTLNKFKYIIDKEYNNIWYDDNIGAFLITVEIKNNFIKQLIKNIDN